MTCILVLCTCLKALGALEFQVVLKRCSFGYLRGLVVLPYRCRPNLYTRSKTLELRLKDIKNLIEPLKVS
jgi:hypothetical protein